MPLASELTRLVLESKRLKRVAEMQRWVKDLCKRISGLEPNGEVPNPLSINIEQLFDFAKDDQELLRMNQQLVSVGRDAGDTPHSRAESIEAWLGYMHKALVQVLWEKQKRADQSGNLCPIERFAERLVHSDTIITFNYDTLLETALGRLRKKWNHGLRDKCDGGVRVLKMHGSVDWFVLERGAKPELERCRKLYSKKDLNAEDEHDLSGGGGVDFEYDYELWRAKDTDALVEMHQSGASTLRWWLGLAGLGRYKPLHTLPGSGPTWQRAFSTLKKAAEIYVIGFSMSTYDTMTRFHFASVMRTRKVPPEKVVLVVPDAVRLAEAFICVFGGPLTLTAKKAEEVDWGKVLG